MRRSILFTFSSLALVLAVGCSTNPVTGKSQLDLMGEAGEIRMGTNFYPGAIQGSLGPIDERDVQATVNRVGQAVAGVSHRPGLPYQFTAVNDPEVNAFALPGGKICITRGLISRLGSEDGLAAVLGHEVGHVTARHAVSAYNRQLLATAILVGGAVYMESEDVRNRGLITVGAIIGTQLILASYSRDQERQSDELGIDYAVTKLLFVYTGVDEEIQGRIKRRPRSPLNFVSEPYSRRLLDLPRLTTGGCRAMTTFV